MFLEHFKLSVQPFGVTPDARFLYLSQTHRETSGGSEVFPIANVPASQVAQAQKRTDEKTPPQLIPDVEEAQAAPKEEHVLFEPAPQMEKP